MNRYLILTVMGPKWVQHCARKKCYCFKTLKTNKQIPLSDYNIYLKCQRRAPTFMRIYGWDPKE